MSFKHFRESAFIKGWRLLEAGLYSQNTSYSSAASDYNPRLPIEGQRRCADRAFIRGLFQIWSRIFLFPAFNSGRRLFHTRRLIKEIRCVFITVRKTKCIIHFVTQKSCMINVEGQFEPRNSLKKTRKKKQENTLVGQQMKVIDKVNNPGTRRSTKWFFSYFGSVMTSIQVHDCLWLPDTNRT